MELDGQIEVTGNSATYSFSGVGTGISGYICKLDGVVLPDCMLFCVVKYHDNTYSYNTQVQLH